MTILIRIFGSRRGCFVCGKTAAELPELMLTASWSDGYAGCQWRYHESCLREVINNPEKHEQILDSALRLTEVLLEKQEQERVRQENRIKSIARARDFLAK